MASLVEADRPRRGWRQIDVTPADKGTAIIDPHRHASIVADADQRPKRKRAVRRGHCGTVEELTARSKVTTQAISVAVDAGHFGVRRHASGKQRECNNSNFRLAGSPPPHGCTNGRDRSKRVSYARNGTGAGGQGLESGRHLLTLSRSTFGICIKWLTLSGSGLAEPILEAEGMPVFDLLRYRQHDRAAVLCAFDLIELDGEDLRRSPLEHRKRALAKLLRQKRDGIVLNAHYVGDGIRTRRCCRATPGAARVCGASHKSSPAIHTR